MRSFTEILRILVIRDKVMLGWKIAFLIVCAALVVSSMMLMRVRGRAKDFDGTVTAYRSEIREAGTVNYLIVRLDSGQTVEARALGPLNFRPGKRAVVREVTTNFFGLKGHEFKGYIESGEPK